MVKADNPRKEISHRFVREGRAIGEPRTEMMHPHAGEPSIEPGKGRQAREVRQETTKTFAAPQCIHRERRYAAAGGERERGEALAAGAEKHHLAGDDISEAMAGNDAVAKQAEFIWMHLRFVVDPA